MPGVRKPEATDDAMDGSWAELGGNDDEGFDDPEMDFPGNDNPTRRAYNNLRQLDSGQLSDHASVGPQSAPSTPRGRLLTETDEWDDDDISTSPREEQAGGALCSGGAAPCSPSQRLPRWPYAGYIPPVRYRAAWWDYTHLAPEDPGVSEAASQARELAFATCERRREWERELGATLLREMEKAVHRGTSEGAIMSGRHIVTVRGPIAC